MDYNKVADDVAPPLLALLLTLLSPAVESFITGKTTDLCENVLGLNGLCKKANPIAEHADTATVTAQEAAANAFVTRAAEYVAQFAISAIALTNHLASLLGFVFGVALIFHTWPDDYAYIFTLV
jgi:hypothetical protein